MEAKDIILGYCKKSKKYYCLECGNVDGKTVVTNMVNPSEAEGKALTTTLADPYINASKHLLACKVCGSRKIAGCNCGPTYYDCTGNNYNIGCIYCKNMEIITDYKASSGEIKLEQGTVIDLSKLVREDEMKEIHFAGGWDPIESSFKKAADIDFSVAMVGPSDYEIVYFGKKDDDARSIHHHGDNLTGAEGYVLKGKDDELIDVNLKKIPEEYTKLYFVINIYSGQHFSQVKNVFVRMYTDKKPKLLRYDVSPNNGRNNALIVAKVERKDSSWTFEPIGDYLNSDIHSFERVLKKY